MPCYAAVGFPLIVELKHIFLFELDLELSEQRQILVPKRSTAPEYDRKLVNRVIYDELCLGELRDDSRNEYRRIIKDLVDSGAEGIIFGCTEIGMLVGPDDSTVPTFDTTEIHAEAAATYALS